MSLLSGHPALPEGKIQNLQAAHCCTMLLPGHCGIGRLSGVQERLRECEASQAEQQQADAEMQASTAKQHAREVSELQAQAESLQARCTAAEARSSVQQQVGSWLCALPHATAESCWLCAAAC